jgi:SPW repeat-containing protein
MGGLVQLAAGILAMHLTLGSAIRSGADSDTNRLITGILLVFVERMTLYFYRTWEEWISVIIGAWLVISPWVLSISVLTARENFVVVGLLVMALTIYELWQARRQSRNG